LFGGPAVSQPLNITSTGGGVFVAVQPSQTWLTVSPTSATVNATTPFQVTANPTSPTVLSTGTYNDTLKILTATQTILVPVTFTVGAIAVSPQSLSFAYTANSQTFPQGQTLTVNGQVQTLSVTSATTTGGNWLTAQLFGTNQVNVVLNPQVLQTLTAATYQGTVTISQAGTSPLNVPVTLTVNPLPPVTVSPTSVNLYYQSAGSPQNNVGVQQTVTLATTSMTPLTFTFGQPPVINNSQNVAAFTVNPSSGTIPAAGSAQAVISYNTAANLPSGTYTPGSIPVGAPGGQISQGSIPINLQISSNPFLIVPTQPLTFAYEFSSGNPPPSQSITAQSTAVLPSAPAASQMPITVSATTVSGGPWLSVSPTTTTTGTPFTVTVANIAGLLPGTYSGSVVVAPAPGVASGNASQTIPVTLTVANDPSILANASFTPVPVTFPYQIGQTAPPAQTINLTSSTGAPLTYSVTGTETTCSSVNWLALGGATSGSTNGSFTITPSNLSSLTAGTCTGTITVTAINPATGNAAVNSPLTIPVTLYVSSTPLLSVSPSSLTFSSSVNGSTGTQSILVNSTSPTAAPLTFNVTASTTTGGNGWLGITSLSGTTAPGSNQITVFVAPQNLSAGTYTGAITITSAGVVNSPVTIPVTFQVSSGSLTVSPTSLAFSFTSSGSNPPAQTVQVTGNGGVLNFTAAANSAVAGTNWLSVTPTTGTTPASLSISVNGAGLSPGTYIGTVTVTSPNAANSPATITVTLTVTSGTLTATPAPTAAGLTFTQPAGGAAPAVQTIAITGAPGPLNFTASGTTTTGSNWLTVTPASGTTPGTVTVSANAGALPVGTYTGTVTIASPGATGSPLNYNVTLNVVTPITIVAAPAALTFGYTLNTAAPAAQTVQITAQGPAGVGTIAMFPYTATVTTSNSGTWLSATPATGNVPGSISVAVNPQGLAAGSYTGTITIASGNQNGATPATVTVKLSVTAAPTPIVAAVANAASYAVGALAPGQEVAVFGSNFGPSTPVSATITNNSFPTILSNTQVLFDGVAAPVIAVANGQVNVMVPYGIAGRATTMVQVVYLGVSSSGITYNVTSTSPGIYTLNQAGTGQGAILNQNLSGNSSSNPAAKGSVIAIYMTGEGVTAPPSSTGQLAPSDGSGLNHPVQTVTAMVGGVPATVQYAGSAPGLVYGVMQVNVLIPAAVSSGPQPLVVTVGTTNSQSAVTVAVQ
jgi:uncharacterized protein (TIGR03437 family)